MDPITAMALMSGGGSALSALGNWIGGGQQRKEQEWSHGQRKDLYNLLRWHTYGKQGPVISPQQMSRMQGQWRQSMQPGFADALWGASRHAGMSSPQTWNMYMKQRMPLEAGFMQALMQQNIGMTQQRDQNLLRLMAGLAGG